MSRLGKQPVTIPLGTEVSVSHGVVKVKGPKGELSRSFKNAITITLDGGVVTLVPKNDLIDTRALWGTYASHLKNMIAGVNKHFEKKLILEGVGFKSEVSKGNLTMALGFSHPVIVPIPEGLTVTAEKNNITITGAHKEQVGEFASMVRSKKPVEPYKGKGLRYDGEHVRHKEGKKTA